jgi:hypothetical protein
VIASRTSAVLIAAIVGCVVLQPLRAHAQWWSARGPADFEECADAAEKTETREARASQLTKCNAKFAGRRKPGGGYTYFDFMQNRSFDIAGPNPTPEEQEHIDQQYTAYLDHERRDSIAAAFAAKQLQLQQASLRNEKVPVAVGTPSKPPVAANEIRPRVKKMANCARDSFSCEWPRLSEGMKDLKKALFGSSSSKAKRG